MEAKSQQRGLIAILVTENIILATIVGRVFGLRHQSFRSELYSALVYLQLLLHVKIYYQKEDTSKLYLGCDNKGLLTRLKTQIKRLGSSTRIYLFS